MKSIFTSMAVALALTVPAALHAEQTPPGKQLAETLFSSVTESGVADMGEFVNFGKDIFVSMDSDDNGSITFEEFSSWDAGFAYIADETDQTRAFETALRILFAFWDRNGNGEISRTEHQKNLTTDFRRADVDGDAYLTQDEYLRHYVVNIAFRAALAGR